jgi:6-phosphogluconolactonase
MDHPTEQPLYVFIGSYANSADPGLYACIMNPVTGELTLTGQTSGLQNPTFLSAQPCTKLLYVLEEDKEEDGRRIGSASAYTYDSAAGRFEQLNRNGTTPAPTCHLQVDMTGQCLMVSSYQGGMIGISPILEDGRIGPVSEVHRHSGSSKLPIQSQARVHSVTLSPDNRFAIVCDLGLDRIFTYRLDPAAPSLILAEEASIAPGAGPRHFAFHPSLPYGYVINELDSTITAFAYDVESGGLTEIQTISTLPSGYKEDNACADIHLSPDGRFLYGSNRGHDSIAVYRVQQDGTLEAVEYASTLGGHPRNFALSPDGRFLLVANRDGNNVVTFRRDEASGKLTPTGAELKLSKPVCLKFSVW